MIAEDAGDLGGNARRLLRPGENVERHGGTITTGALLAADEHVEAVDLLTIQFAIGRHEGDVLRFGVATILQAAGDRDIELARQVGELAVADDDVG